ncbi:MAG: membrane protein insertase YidC, partial [Alphaproteobacteria bacterium]
MQNNRNVIVAIALSFLVLLGWQYFIAGPKLKVERQKQAAEQAALQAEQLGSTAPGAGGVAGTAANPTGNSASGTGNSSPGAPTIPGSDAASVVASQETPVMPGGAAALPQARDAALSRSARVTISTPKLKGSINLTGGRIDDLLLTKYRETLDAGSPLIEFLSPVGSASPYYAEFGWVTTPDGPSLPGVDTVWKTDRATLSVGQPVTLTWENGSGLTFTRQISVDEDYLFSVTQGVANSGSDAATLYPYGLVHRRGDPNASGFFILHEGMTAAIKGADDKKPLLELTKYKKLDTIESFAAETGWVGIADKYWATALIPAGDSGFEGRFVPGKIGEIQTYQADYRGDAVVVPAGGSASTQTRLFAGAKEYSVLSAYKDNPGIARIDDLIDWGWFYFLTRPMFLVIHWLVGQIGNFGLAILAVTVLVKAIFFPLANKSYASMSKMKKVQPEVKKLQERFKDDRAALQKEMMGLYKKEKINPLSGCWPIVIQIPVFFSLYKVLFVTIEMRHAPFFGWIQDLSAPDPTSFVNLFGLLPFTP